LRQNHELKLGKDSIPFARASGGVNDGFALLDRAESLGVLEEELVVGSRV
jgi:hypothetical protein